LPQPLLTRSARRRGVWVAGSVPALPHRSRRRGRVVGLRLCDGYPAYGYETQ
jgi:hypothetical protein